MGQLMSARSIYSWSRNISLDCKIRLLAMKTSSCKSAEQEYATKCVKLATYCHRWVDVLNQMLAKDFGDLK